MTVQKELRMIPCVGPHSVLADSVRARPHSDLGLRAVGKSGD